MNIAITAETPEGLNSPVALHFGRSPYYVFVTIEDGRIVSAWTVPNPLAGGHRPGELPSLIKRYGVDVMLTGGIGSRAVSFFTDYGIEVATGASGTVRSAVDAYLTGQLRGFSPCHEQGAGHDHHCDD